jgi:hypothetical protein
MDRKLVVLVIAIGRRDHDVTYLSAVKRNN